MIEEKTGVTNGEHKEIRVRRLFLLSKVLNDDSRDGLRRHR
jgi:hypothetical protein